MIAEAKNRMEANRQRRRMKQLLSAASDDGATVATKDLLFAAKLAKVALPEEFVSATPYVAVSVNAAPKRAASAIITAPAARVQRSLMRDALLASSSQGLDGLGCPTRIKWQPFIQQMPPPAMRKPGSYGKLAPLRREREVVEVVEEDKARSPVKDEMPLEEDVMYWFSQIQNKMRDRFAEVRRAFRSLDADASGHLEFNEFREMLTMFNLNNMPENCIKRIFQLADFDGTGDISYAEFARLITTDNIMSMKNTISALDSEQVIRKATRVAAEGSANVDKELGYNTKLRRTGPGLPKLRRFHAVLRGILENEFGFGDKGMRACYRAMDIDNSGLVRRAELR